jgi:hypothetical protein
VKFATLISSLFNFRDAVVPFLKDPDVNGHIFMTSNGGTNGVVGYAWLGTVCDLTMNFKTTVNEYYLDDLRTGVVSHLKSSSL